MATITLTPSTLSTEALRATANTNAINSALSSASSGDTVFLSAGSWPLEAQAAGTILMPTNRKLIGAGIGVTNLFLATRTGTTVGNVITNSGGLAANIEIGEMSIDGGRTYVAGCTSGACIQVSGQNDWAGVHNLNVHNVFIKDGQIQNWQLNSINGGTVTGLKGNTSAVAQVAAGHTYDHDAVADLKPTQNVTFTDCVFDGWGEVKFENSKTISFVRCEFFVYISLVQDNVDVYSELGPVTFTDCYFNDYISHTYPKRRKTASGANTYPVGKTLTLSGSNTIGGTLNSSGTLVGSDQLFSGGDVGKAIGFYSGQGYGMGIITAINGNQGCTLTVTDIFSTLTLPSAPDLNNKKWVIAVNTDNGGNGGLTFVRCKFGINACVAATVNNSNDYGTITVTNCTFNIKGNSYHYPSGTAITATGNLGANPSVRKHFVGPSATIPGKYGTAGNASAEYPNNSFLFRGNYGLGGSSGIDTIVNHAGVLSGEEVWVLDGTYNASIASNRSLNCRGKNIILRAETKHGAILEGGGLPQTPFTLSTSDPPGSLIWGFLAQNFSGSGSGGGINITTGSNTIRSCKFVSCTTTNGGGGLRTSGTIGTVLLEDIEWSGCQHTGANSTGGGWANIAGTFTAMTIRRFKVTGCTDASTSNGGAARVQHTSGILTLESGVISGNSATAGSTNAGGIFTTGTGANMVLRNMSMANNTGGTSGAGDVRLSGSGSVAMTGWINNLFRSTSGLRAVDRSGGTAGTVSGRNNTVLGLSSITSWFTDTVGSTNFDRDPLFTNAAGNDLTLTSGSPELTSGFDLTTTTVICDVTRKPYAQFTPSRGAYQY